VHDRPVRAHSLTRLCLAMGLPVFEICRKNGIMYQSFWTLSGNPTLLAHPTLKKLAEKYELTPEQALYKFCSM
jgi:diketogulonate reductase-like aldo/keto reductase